MRFPLSLPQLPRAGGLLLLLSALAGQVTATESVELGNGSVTMQVSTQGSTLTSLRIPGTTENWLDPRGHFLCFDRWGPVTEDEAALGIPFHGEARATKWNLRNQSALATSLTTTLPITHFTLDRHVQLARSRGAFGINTRIKNPTSEKRGYNLVEHITLGKPWHQPGNRIVTNASHGFLQLHLHPELDTELTWPRVNFRGRTIDLSGDFVINGRLLVSLVFPDDADWAWVCLFNKETSKLLGYLWPKTDYPWLHLWWYMDQDAIVRRAIEPGTTGLHLPMPELLKAAPRFGLPLVQSLEADANRAFSLWAFAVTIPPDAGSVTQVSLQGEALHIEFGNGIPSMKLPLPERRQGHSALPKETLNYPL